MEVKVQKIEEKSSKETEVKKKKAKRTEIIEVNVIVNQIKTTTDAIMDRRETAKEEEEEAKMEQNHGAREKCRCMCLYTRGCPRSQERTLHPLEQELSTVMSRLRGPGSSTLILWKSEPLEQI